MPDEVCQIIGTGKSLIDAIKDCAEILNSNQRDSDQSRVGVVLYGHYNSVYGWFCSMGGGTLPKWNRQGPFCVKFACIYYVCLSFLQVLRNNFHCLYRTMTIRHHCGVLECLRVPGLTNILCSNWRKISTNSTI